jgi:hypothetical protein
MNFVCKNDILYSKQFGFRERSNTEVAAIELVNDIRINIDKKKKVSLVMMDVKKAFDSVNINQLIMSLERSGIRGMVLNLLKSYLTNRHQIVRIGNSFSTKKSVTSGVVQGGTLGSLLFLIFFNEISQIKLNGILYLYADDVLLLNVHDKDDDIEEIVRKDVLEIIKFLTDKQLALNENKTVYLIMHSAFQKLNDGNEIAINENFIMKRTKSAKYLGLILDENLKFDEHCKQLESKLASSAGILWKMRNKLPIYIKKKVYQTLFESHLLYMNVLWGTACDKVIKPLQTIQNRALRSVYNLRQLDNRTEMYFNHTESCLPIRGINFLLSATFIYKSIHNNIRTNLNFMQPETRRGRSRNRHTLLQASYKTNYGTKSIMSHGVKIFNDLPTELKELKDPAAFKWALRCHLRNEEFISSCFSNKYLTDYC